MKKIYMIITNSGDGSNSIHIAKDEEVLAKMEQLADDGDECYSSGDGLQKRLLEFPDDFDVDDWVAKHFYRYTELDELDYESY